MSLFRKSALDRLSSPERLDTVFVAASPGYWIAFLALALLVASAVAWSLIGRLPTRVAGDGILLSARGEVFSAAAKGPGSLREFLVQPGERVSAGQTLAVIDQSLAVRRRDAEAATLAQMEARQADLVAEDRAQGNRRAEIIVAQKIALVGQLQRARERLVAVRGQATDQRALMERGFTTRARVLDSDRELNDLTERIEGLEQKSLSLTSDEMARQAEWRLKLLDHENDVKRQRDKLKTVELELRANSAVEAPVDGIVTELAASLGDVVAAGAPVLRIVQEAAAMDALVFLPPLKAKQVRPGMAVQVEPGVAKKEEYGAVLGRVRTVSDLPASREALAAMLHNEELVRLFMKEGPPVIVRADLETDGEGVSGLRWAGGRGPDFRIEPGTLARLTVSVREQAPASLVLPFLRSLIGA
ncbi:HlyD family secretion protein [Azospirillum agricola]|uniref:NHLP bacteriocin system secretion protein n=1 Tax=Azospirillum agricola TaxID=1720247 RepID=UPI001AE497D1|nr:NHLP bacteriocin system secretion protein [Azospirillum agricola]MBP2230946.1 HlyD family secretion protein [Azospirillum agricola]